MVEAAVKALKVRSCPRSSMSAFTIMTNHMNDPKIAAVLYMIDAALGQVRYPCWKFLRLVSFFFFYSEMFRNLYVAGLPGQEKPGKVDY
jgi:hypothetical protein